MAKRKASDSKNPTVNVVDRSIQIRTVDRSVKTLATWKQALVSAESLVQPVRQALYDLYADVIIDDHLISVMGKRRRAISRASISFQHNGEPVEAIQQLMAKQCFHKLLTYIIDARLYGYSLIQVDLLNLCVDLVPRPHVVPSRSLVVATPYEQTGIDYTQPPYDRFYLGVGDTDDLGLLFPAAYCVLLKRGDITDWATFNEIFGQPLRKGTYDPLDPGQKTQLEQALANMGSAAWVVVPEGSDVEFSEANRTGAKDTFEAFAARMDKAISKIIIGQTMTTEDGSSRSQAEVHERVADEIVMDDLDFVIGYLNERLKPMLLAQGFPVSEGDFVVIEEEAKLTKKERLDMDLRIHKEVAPIEIDYFAQEYNVPIDLEALKVRQEQAAQMAENPAPVPSNQKPGKKATPKKQKLTADIDNLEVADDDQPDASPYSLRALLSTLESFFAKAPTR